MSKINTCLLHYAVPIFKHFFPHTVCVCVCRFWKRLSRFMSKLNPEPNLIHVMGCYVLGNPNGEKVGLVLRLICCISLANKGKSM